MNGRRILSDYELERYSRHVRLDEVGLTGQRKLIDSKVAIIGAGGLGSPAALYLAAAGVGTIGLIDYDEVDLSNLQRQVLHFTNDVGRPKTESARDHLKAINPDMTVVEHRHVLDSDNALDVLRPYDVIINGSDNFPTRYLVNDAAYLLGKPLVDASILRFEGQAAVYMPDKGCYRCLFPEPPPPGMVPTCSDAGIIGALAGHMGTLQAMEAVKLLLGIGRPLVNRLLIYDGLDGHYHTLNWRRNPSCPLCGDNPTVRELIDYDEFCGVPAGEGGAGDPVADAVTPSSAGMGEAQEAVEGAEILEQAETGEVAEALQGTEAGEGAEAAEDASEGDSTAAGDGSEGDPTVADPSRRPLTMEELSQWEDEEVHARQISHLISSGEVNLIDVREPEEYTAVRIPGSRLIPLGRLDPSPAGLTGNGGEEKPVVFVCRSGERSLMATKIARGHGVRSAVNLHMGMIGWLNEGLPAESGEH